jgi:hypothetical protein
VLYQARVICTVACGTQTEFCMNLPEAEYCPKRMSDLQIPTQIHFLLHCYRNYRLCIDLLQKDMFGPDLLTDIRRDNCHLGS